MGKAGKKGSLKAALSSQQTRLRKKEEAVYAAQHAERTKSAIPRARGKAKAHLQQAYPTIPFNSTDRILLVGEGNFAFTRALVCSPQSSLEFLPSSNVTATAYDTEEECCSKYHDAQEIIAALREKGVELLFSVDATKLERCAALKGRTFDRIVWNFPHAGKGITDQDRNILCNQVLLLGFLRSAASFLVSGSVPLVHRTRRRKSDHDDTDGSGEDDVAEEKALAVPKTRGTILITLRNVSPYTLWDLPKLAKNPPPSTDHKPNPRYVQLRSFVFHRRIWVSYQHRMTKGERAHGLGKTGEGGEDRTWEFYLPD